MRACMGELVTVDDPIHTRYGLHMVPCFDGHDDVWRMYAWVVWILPTPAIPWHALCMIKRHGMPEGSLPG